MRARRWKALTWFLGLLTLVTSPIVCEGAQDKDGAKDTIENWQLGFTPYYSSGDYGTASTTTITYLPLSIRRLFDNGDITLIIPYISITGSGAVTVLSGVPNRVSGSGASGGGGGGGGKNKKPGTVPPTDPGESTDSGLGDIILRGRYYLLDERGPFPTLALTGRIKFPTADSDRGLGTGRFDEGFGLEVTKKLVGNWIGFLDLGYTFIGDPPTADLRNQWNYDLGLGYYFTKDLLGSFYYEEWRALVEGLSNPRDLLFAMNYKATSVLRFNASLLVGLSDGAPDYGFTGGISFRF
jgi:hypothetical protein